MPTGIYHRTKTQLKAVKKNLAKGRTKKARKKAAKTLTKIAKDPKWRSMVSENTKKAMHDPIIRKKHLDGMAKAHKKYGVNFKGGNGLSPTPIIRLADRLLKLCGYERELAVKTKPVRSKFRNKKLPDCYKIDFGNREEMIAIEFDGQCHQSLRQQKIDKKKTKVLQELGWTVVRLKHK